jgi:choline dehydrogenase
MAGNIPLHVPRGKTLGGSSARNFMAYHRGTAGSYQKWADLLDDHSYTFDALLRFFERSVTFTPPDNAKRFTNATPEWDPQTLKASHSPLHVSFPNYAQAFSTWARLAFEDLGFESIPGFNSGKLIGASWAPTTTNPDTAERDSSETSFLRYSLGKPNYRVYINTLAKNIVFEDKRAAGVEVDTLGARYTLSASKEVIVSGGAYHSPQLLLVSGIGPAALLRGLNISVVSDRPGVGQNFQASSVLSSQAHFIVDTIPGSHHIWVGLSRQCADCFRCRQSETLHGGCRSIQQKCSGISGQQWC